MTESIAILKPLNAETRESIERDSAVIERLPYRVGRESRFGMTADGQWRSLERRSGEDPASNELYMHDHGKLLNVSRDHFQIERGDDGGYVLVDRGSTCGTIVDGETVGGSEEGGRCPLKSGARIVVGTHDSPYAFEFRLVSVD